MIIIGFLLIPGGLGQVPWDLLQDHKWLDLLTAPMESNGRILQDVDVSLGW